MESNLSHVAANWDFSPKIIMGDKVRLEPLEDRHLDEICEALIPDSGGWYSVMFGLNTRSAYQKEIDDAKRFAREKSGMGFLIRDLKTSKAAGITFFLKMDRANRTLEIGTTNIAPEFRKTYVNTAAKFLMLDYAFTMLNCIRVSFRVDEANVVSRKAIERLGAVYSGLLRNERILPDGRIRNYCFYSIIDMEWPAVKERLLRSLSRA